MSEYLRSILDAIIVAFGRPMIVGGWVRDNVLGYQPKDIDVEVYGMSLDTLAGVLRRFGVVDFVGVSFGVLRLHGLDVDFSIPRRDSKLGSKHTDFEVTCAPGMSIADAAARRDFTINSMAYDPETGGIEDPFQGQDDLRRGILRHTSAAFTEDPLRVLRGMQFCGRFGLTAAPETLALARSIRHEYDHLSLDRVWGEWWKWASKSVTPSLGLVFLKDAGWLPFALQRLVGCQQDPEWHPEGDVWQHTLRAVDAAATLGRNPQEQGLLVLAALLHDVGKPDTTTQVGGRWISPGHAAHGAPLAKAILTSLGAPDALAQQVEALVYNHMAHINPVNPSNVRRLALRLAESGATIANLVDVITCDHSARPPLPGGTPESAIKMLHLAEELRVQASAPRPLVMGRHMLELGWKPGVEMGAVLRMAFDAQLDGEFETLEEGITWVKRFTPNP